MDTSGMVSILQNFGSFGLALGVVGSVGWIVWKKIIVPQQEELRKETDAHIETLHRLVDDNRHITQEFIDSSKENIIALKELNGKIFTHHIQMQEEHKRGMDLLKK